MKNKYNWDKFENSKVIRLLCWSRLDKVKDIKLISSMYVWIFIVPIVAKLFSMTSDIVNITVFSYKFNVNLTLPFSWKVFYFSAVSFAIANLIYQTKCPRLIKEYSTYSVFEAEGKPEWHLADYAEDIGENFEKYKKSHQYAMGEFAGQVAKGNEFTQSLFWHLFRSADHHRKLTLLFCLLFYVVGFILIGYVFVQNFCWVIKNIIGYG